MQGYYTHANHQQIEHRTANGNISYKTDSIALRQLVAASVGQFGGSFAGISCDSLNLLVNAFKAHNYNTAQCADGIQFAGGSKRIIIPDTTGKLNFGTGDFTVEVRFK